MGVKVRKWGKTWYVVHHFGGRRETKSFNTQAQADKQARRLRHEISQNGYSGGMQHKSAPVFIKPFDDSNCSLVHTVHKFGTLYKIKKQGEKLDYRQFTIPRNSFVYGIQGGPGLIKIGVTGNVRSRFSSLESASPVALSLVFCADTNAQLETFLHQQFKSDRHHGEWFEVEFKYVMRMVLKYLDGGRKYGF